MSNLGPMSEEEKKVWENLDEDKDTEEETVEDDKIIPKSDEEDGDYASTPKFKTKSRLKLESFQEKMQKLCVALMKMNKISIQEEKLKAFIWKQLYKDKIEKKITWTLRAKRVKRSFKKYFVTWRVGVTSIEDG